MPKKLRLEAVMMEVPMDMVYCTMILGMALGRICLNRMRMSPAPILRGGLYKHAVLCLQCIASHQTSKLGDIEYRTAITTLYSPLPRMATMAIARISPGKASSTSQIRMMMESTMPP